MPIARNIAQIMNGDIKVESRKNAGSKFTFTFFLKMQNTQAVHNPGFTGLPVLVVDDDQIACESACAVLEDIGMQPEAVQSGKEAVKLVLERHNGNNDFYAVIINWKMTDMNGLEVTRAIRSQVGKDVPIIIISSYDWSDIEAQAREAGANEFISKPIFKSRMVYLLQELVNNSDYRAHKAETLEGIRNQDFSGKRLLLVEDNELSAEITGEILKMAKLEVDYAVNGKEAVDKLFGEQPGYYNLVLMDIQMPVMNGYEATKAIRASQRADLQQIPVIAMTANAFSEDVQAAHQAGMNQHMAKPLDFDKLNQMLQKWLG